MPVEERTVQEIQDECAGLAAEVDAVARKLVALRSALRLPADTLSIYEAEEIPWPVELELDAVMGAVLDDDLGPAAERLRKASRVTGDQLRQRFLARQAAKRREAKARTPIAFKGWDDDDGEPFEAPKAPEKPVETPKDEDVPEVEGVENEEAEN